jgi:hypothetical protein
MELTAAWHTLPPRGVGARPSASNLAVDKETADPLVVLLLEADFRELERSGAQIKCQSTVAKSTGVSVAV